MERVSGPCTALDVLSDVDSAAGAGVVSALALALGAGIDVIVALSAPFCLFSSFSAGCWVNCECVSSWLCCEAVL